MFVGYCSRADVDEELFVLLVFAEHGCVRTNEFGPKGGEEVAFESFLGVGLADDGALQVEELAVDGFKEGEEGRGMSEFAVDGFFEDI